MQWTNFAVAILILLFAIHISTLSADDGKSNNIEMEGEIKKSLGLARKSKYVAEMVLRKMSTGGNRKRIKTTPEGIVAENKTQTKSARKQSSSAEIIPVGILKKNGAKSTEMRGKRKKTVRFRIGNGEDGEEEEETGISSLQRMRGIKLIRDFQTFLENDKVYRPRVLGLKNYIPVEFDVPKWDGETCRRLEKQFNEMAKGKRGKEAEEEEEALVGELSGMVAWPMELEAIGKMAKEKVDQFYKEEKNSNRNGNRQVELNTKIDALWSLKDFRQRANVKVEKLVEMVRRYPEDFFLIDHQLNGTREAIQKLVKSNMDNFRGLEREHYAKRRELIEGNIEGKVPELTRCPWVIRQWGTSSGLKKGEKEELGKCRANSDYYIEAWWKLPTAEDWRGYFPSEKGGKRKSGQKETEEEMPRMLVPESADEPTKTQLQRFKDELLGKFAAFRKYSYVDATVGGEDFFGKFLFGKDNLEGLRKIGTKLKGLWSIHWVASKKGRERRAMLKRQIKSVEMLAKFGTELNGAVEKMREDILAHAKILTNAKDAAGNGKFDGIARRISVNFVTNAKGNATVKGRIVENVHVMILKWAPMYFELRLFLELNNSAQLLYGLMKQLALVPAGKLREALEKVGENQEKGEGMGENVEEDGKKEEGEKELKKWEEEDGEEIWEESEEELGIMAAISKYVQKERVKLKEDKEAGKQKMLRENFAASLKVYGRIRALLGCLKMDEGELKEGIVKEEKKRRTIVGQIGRKITRTLTKIRDYFAGRREITYDGYKPEQFHVGAERRVRELVGKVLVVYERIMKDGHKGAGAKVGHTNSKEGDEEPICNKEMMKVPRKIEKLLTEMFWGYL